jgi:hypothetical protein
VRKIKKPHSPTRRCPHRWCRSLHRLGGALALAALGPMLFHAGVLFLLFMTISILVVFQVVKIAWKGKSMMDLAIDDTAAEGSGSDGNMSTRFLIVRPVWARIAVAMDVLGALNICTILWSAVRGHVDHSTPTSSADALIALGLMGLIVWFWEFAHRKATEPATPLRLPSFAKTPEAQS